ncbi:uncharacterized protein BROUX77_003018 [Berkeleyomyces rouxiae]|uniref:uncharacterized protein n=1 Tax=Berkeleyomyces rouxiae TaxID=2035830 RepID=UPI003B793A2B
MSSSHRRKRSSELFVSSPDLDDSASPSAYRSPSSRNPGSASKRQRTHNSAIPPIEEGRLFLERDDADSIFGAEDLEDGVIDLRPSENKETADEKAAREEAERREQRKNWVRLAKFQCAICMDDATQLTVTHCGHMFCLECLTSALKSEYETNKCPICRQKVDMKERSAYNTKTKGYWPLEVKLKTRPRTTTTTTDESASH